MRELGTISVGDVVVVAGRYECRLSKVERLTPTQAVVDGHRYRLDNGLRIGGYDWRQDYISTQPKDILRAKQQLAQSELRVAFSLSRAGVDRARAVADYAEEVLREMSQWE